MNLRNLALNIILWIMAFTIIGMLSSVFGFLSSLFIGGLLTNTTTIMIASISVVAYKIHRSYKTLNLLDAMKQDLDETTKS
jgi:hypothetical protein